MKEDRVLDPIAKVTSFRNRQKVFQNYFLMNEEKTYAYCNVVPQLMEAMNIEYKPDDWRLFIDSSKESLKYSFVEFSIGTDRFIPHCCCNSLIGFRSADNVCFYGEKGDGKISSFFQRSTQSPPSKLLQNESLTPTHAPTPSTSFEMIDMIKKGRKALKQYAQSGDGFVYLWLRRADYNEMMLIETIDDQIDFVENNACYTGREMFGIQLITRFGNHCNPKNYLHSTNF